MFWICGHPAPVRLIFIKHQDCLPFLKGLSFLTYICFWENLTTIRWKESGIGHQQNKKMWIHFMDCKFNVIFFRLLKQDLYHYLSVCLSVYLQIYPYQWHPYHTSLTLLALACIPVVTININGLMSNIRYLCAFELLWNKYHSFFLVCRFESWHIHWQSKRSSVCHKLIFSSFVLMGLSLFKKQIIGHSKTMWCHIVYQMSDLRTFRWHGKHNHQT